MGDPVVCDVSSLCGVVWLMLWRWSESDYGAFVCVGRGCGVCGGDGGA